MDQGLDWSILWNPPFGEAVLAAVLTTLEISLISGAAAFIIGVAVGLTRSSPHAALRGLATLYVEVFRNIPLLVQLFFMYYVLPRVLPMELRRELFSLGWEVTSAILTISLYTASKIAEHVRAGLNTVGRQMRLSALSTGLTWWESQRLVVAPLLLRIIVPSLTSEFVTVFKSSSLAMTVGVVETSYITQQLGLQTFHWVEASTLGTAVYLACAWAVTGLMHLVERRARVPGLLRRETS